MSVSGTPGDPEVQEEIDLILQEEALNSCEGFRREATRIHGSEPLISYPQENSNVFQPQSGPPDPHTGSSSTGLKYSEPELEQIRDLFPWTLNIPGNLIQKASLQELSSMNKANLTSTDMSRQGIANQLQANNRALIQPKHTGTHIDDSLNSLCPVRFDRFPRLSIRELMVAAKKVVPANGLPPSDNYDLDFFGLSHCVSARGWVEVHNPGSTSMCLRMFSRFNSSSTTSSSQAKFSLLGNGEAIGVGENYKDIFSMAELKQSLRAYQTASFMAIPWYPAPAALILFLEHHQFMINEIQGNQAKILTDFCNTVFLKNAKLWRSADPPLSVELLRNTWQHFVADNSLGSQPSSSVQENQKQNSTQFRNPPSLGKSKFSPLPLSSSSHYNSNSKRKSSYAGGEICIRYNQGICPSQNLHFCMMPSRSGANPRPLKHVCFKCNQPHPQFKHN